MGQGASSRLNTIRDHLKLCRQKCSECFYPCLLRKNHEDHAEWDDEHSCKQTDHTCRLMCTYCIDKGKEIRCALKCGHQGIHNCKQESHTCGQKCSLSEYGGCQTECELTTGHLQPCKCAAETHFCVETCDVEICKNRCQVAYNKSHEQVSPLSVITNIALAARKNATQRHNFKKYGGNFRLAGEGKEIGRGWTYTVMGHVLLCRALE